MIYLGIVLIYICVAFFYTEQETESINKIHSDNSFWGFWISYNYRDRTRIDVIRGLLWPLLLIVWLLKGTIFTLLLFVEWIFLLFITENLKTKKWLDFFDPFNRWNLNWKEKKK